MAPLLALERIGKTFGALQVIDAFSASVDGGEILGVVGPNGAGKTTLLNLVSAATPLSAGHIWFDGVDVTRTGPEERCRLGIARTYQVPQPFRALTVFENVLVGATYGCGRPERRAAHVAAFSALERAGLAPYVNQVGGSLTLLQRKQLELARALATEPRLLLLDEPAGGLADSEVPELVSTIGELRGQGITVIWIEHVLHALLAVVDRILAMESGRVLIEGDPRAVMASPEIRRVYLGLDETATALVTDEPAPHRIDQ
jgi:branched-chain amino acid transport system ATP-binding protein